LHSHAPFVLALEPDHRQASVLKRVIRDRVHAELMVVDSRDAAIAATSSRIPDVILLTALLSPRDEQELIAHLRDLSGAEHVQTHTIPQLASSSHDGDGGQEGGGLFGKLRRKKSADAIPGCDPTAFADEVSTFIARAAEMKAHAALAPPPVIERSRRDDAAPHEPVARDTHSAAHAADATAEEPAVDSGSSWASPFEWRRSDPAGQKKKETAPRKPLVTNAPLAVVAEEEETRRLEEERRAREDTERDAREDAERRARQDTERRAREEERRAKEEAERLERETVEAERRAQDEAKRQAKHEAERQAKEEAERRAKQEAERRANEEAVRRAKEEAERRAKEEAAHRAKEEAERRANEEADRRAKEEAARRAKEEAERRAKEEAERRAKEEAARRAKEEAERRAKEEAARRAKEEAARRAKEEAERRAKEEAARRAKEEAERRAKEEAERRAKEEAARRAKEEAARRANEEAERRAKEEAERRANEEAARRAKEEEERRAKEEADRKAKEEAKRKAREEAERVAAEAAAEQERLRREAEERARQAAELEIEIDLDHDPFSDFRVEEGTDSPLLKLMPVSAWARPDSGKRHSAAASKGDEFRDLIAGLSIPANVAGVAYARGCRIRRVRVPAPRQPGRSRMSHPVILSKRALEDARNDQQSGA
jgi:CheY-like chemotaxis protein